ncbi:MAG: protein-methionine-sulfoxide reductase heme-binding subunit MsrQ [Pseudomonadota bacterium]
MTLTDKINRTARKVPSWPIYVAGTLPLLWLVFLLFTGGLGVDPVKSLEHRLGEIGLQFLVASLAVTPLCRYARLNLIKFRRAIGLLAFYYVLLHVLVWLLLDMQLIWSEILKDLYKRPYIFIGMVGFLALIPLALTSNDYSIKKMGAAAWRKLHKLAYLAGIAGALHYMMLVKAWPIEPILYCAAVAALLLIRAEWSLQRRLAAAAQAAQ